MYELTYGPNFERYERRCDLLACVERTVRASTRLGDYLGGHARTWDAFFSRVARCYRMASAARRQHGRLPRPRIWRVDEPYDDATWDGRRRSCCVMFVIVDMRTQRPRIVVLGASNDVRGSYLQLRQCVGWLRRFRARLRDRLRGRWDLVLRPFRGCYAGHRVFRRAIVCLLTSVVPADAKESTFAQEKSDTSLQHHGDRGPDV